MSNWKDFLPDRRIITHPYHHQLFYYWLYARQEIWYRRFMLELPAEHWTSDEILRKHKFTNCYRELDRNTVFYILSVANNIAFDDYTKIMNTFIFRLINNPVTFIKAGFLDSYYNWPQYKEHLLKVMDELGENPFTNAYFIHPIPGLTRNQAYVNVVLQEAFDNLELFNKVIKYGTPAEMCKAFVDKVHCVGDFIAYELYCDFVHTKLTHYGFNDYVNIGPGALGGLDWIYPHTQDRKLPESYRIQLMHVLRDSADYNFRKYGYDFKYIRKRQLDLRVIEHSLCEVDKYIKCVYNTGRRRMGFDQSRGIDVSDYAYQYYKTIPIC